MTSLGFVLSVAMEYTIQIKDSLEITRKLIVEALLNEVSISEKKL